MASNSSQPNSRTKLYSSSSARFSLTFISLLVTNLLYLHAFAMAESNPSPSHFSRFSRHPFHNDAYEPKSKSPVDESPRTGQKAPNGKYPKQEFYSSVEESVKQALWARSLALNLTISRRTAPTHVVDPANDCLELLDDTLDMLSRITAEGNRHSDEDDVHTWLSAALTNQETCKQSLQENSKVHDHDATMDFVARNLSNLLTNSLDLFVSSKSEDPSSLVGGGRRKLLSENFPSWVSSSTRKLLEAPVTELRVHAVVTADGSGTHMSIGEALASAAGSGRSVIYVKAGTYDEHINIPTKQKNVMLVGDGKGKTVITGSRSNRGGWTTYQTATVAAMGDGFIARDVTIVNSAGPKAEQAVALRLGGDKSVVYHCSLEGYQDTLYTHSKRQFYRETDIYGTVDFIFGNSAAVFQSCNIMARRSGQTNFVTAQGRINPNQNTGISIHNSKVGAAENLGGSKTYLGRPWRQYSRTVIMQSFLDGSIHPAGWSPWSGNFALNTLFYGEYGNSGPGSSVSGRVKWPGYHPSLSLAQAQGFTVSALIDGNMWLPSTGVSFDSGLVK
ncbi:PREDICTED: probable pectinesterase/pectinesterase inhibitor 35 [Tarenaya hassleriana]|uniref:probable pectinesterase/pectinesterase inhibitor 35 n=1 Tax=Tarenaya hassleriana TaxID=28532 RepID=UPI00053C59EE|nr:PREDICTED: probable pectinesterase/pectinesterase inhibitor 35 [Tarenaya hassleriana]